MQRILNLIECTLDAEITPADLADASGYSLWHFLHLFRQEVGMPLNRYRTRRRIHHALWQVQQGASVTDAALRWGFDSYSGFYRAVCKEYGCTPRMYLRTYRLRKPRVPLLKEEEHMLTRDHFRQALTHWQLDLPLTPVLNAASGQPSDHAMYVGDDLVLKAYRDSHTCRLALAMADALRAKGLPAHESLPLPDGTRSLPFAGFHLTLNRRIPGAARRAADLLMDPALAYRAGAALAQLHQALADLENLAYAEELDPAAQLLDWALPQAQETLPATFPADYADRARALRELPRCLLHRDPNPGNLIAAGDAVGFIDFDLSARGPRLFDPCYLATAVLSETWGRDELPCKAAWWPCCRAILSGYGSITPLTPQEAAAVPTLLLGNELLAVAAFRDSQKYRDVFEVNLQMLGWLTEHPDEMSME